MKIRNVSQSIERIVAREERSWQSKVEKDRERRTSLSRKLGDRAMKGEPIGFTGFMAIGFPDLTPESEEYKRLLNAYVQAVRIPADSYVRIGDPSSQITAIKAFSGEEGIAFSVDREASGRHIVEAQILCKKAVYNHTLPPSATVYGTEDHPYPVSFMDSFILGTTASPVTRIDLSNSMAPTHPTANEILENDSYAQLLAGTSA
ncbi:hypothetical protein HZB74_03100 [Candidatus Saccharibacteria bacterium]|nr:hypothetical protein [Candidatus Saccharibacteria bacterium]